MKNKRTWIILIIVISLLRFLLSYKLPSFYLSNLRYDDGLMVNQLSTILKGNYLGDYSNYTLIKGIAFPFFLALSNILKISYSVFFTIIYIVSCLFFTSSLEKIIKDKKYLLITYIFLLFNPISYSSDLFQRLYRNSISIIELYLFLGIVIRIILNEKEKNNKLYISWNNCINNGFNKRGQYLDICNTIIINNI